MPPEIPACEFGQGLLPLHGVGPGDSLLDQGVGVLFAAHRSAANEGIQLGVHQDAREALTARHYAGRREILRQLCPGPVMTAPQGSPQNGVRAFEDPLIQPQCSVVVRQRRTDTRRRQLLHPAEIRRCDEMPRRPHHVRAENSAEPIRLLHIGIDAAPGPLADRPLGSCVILRLDGAQPGDHLARPPEAIPDDRVTIQPPARNLRCLHAQPIGTDRAAGE